MLEEVLVTARYNYKIDPVLGIWSWEIPSYLFLGGLTAGIMFFAAALVLSGREKDHPFAAHQLPLWAPVGPCGPGPFTWPYGPLQVWSPARPLGPYGSRPGPL